MIAPSHNQVLFQKECDDFFFSFCLLLSCSFVFILYLQALPASLSAFPIREVLLKRCNRNLCWKSDTQKSVSGEMDGCRIYLDASSLWFDIFGLCSRLFVIECWPKAKGTRNHVLFAGNDCFNSVTSQHVFAL